MINWSIIIFHLRKIASYKILMKIPHDKIRYFGQVSMINNIRILNFAQCSNSRRKEKIQSTRHDGLEKAGIEVETA